MSRFANTTVGAKSRRPRRASGIAAGLAVALATAGLLTGCGSDKPSAETTVAPPAASEPTPTEAAEAQPAAGNACPVDGCMITIKNVTKNGDEFSLELESNFAPDVSVNHYHIYWDKYTAEQVSNDAVAKGVEQGEWVPTADSPLFTTKDVVSAKNRGESNKLCVTAGDRNHNVIDASLINCADVSALP